MSKNKEKLDSLTAFLTGHPELRFWQGLLAWAREYYKDDMNQTWSFGRLNIDGTDTFYWE